MKNKKFLLGGLVILFFIIVGILLFIGLSKDDKKETKEPEENLNTNVDVKYEIEDVSFESLNVTNIEFENFSTDSILRLTLENNSENVFPEGILNFRLLNDKKEVTIVSSYASAIEPYGSVELEIVLNDIYTVTDIEVTK